MSNKNLISILSYLGTIPFIFFSLYLLSKKEYPFEPADSLYYYICYSAVILSFLAGINWGQALVEEKKVSFHLVLISNVVAIAAWAALLLSNLYIVLAIFGFGYLNQLFIDKKLMDCKLVEYWYFFIRCIVTAIVLFSILVILLSIN